MRGLRAERQISDLLRHEPESDRVLALKGATRGKNELC